MRAGGQFSTAPAPVVDTMPTMRGMRTVSTFVGAAIGAALLAACSPSGETVTVVNECGNEISVVGFTMFELPTQSPLPDGTYPAPVDQLESDVVAPGSSAVFAFDSEPAITVVSMGISQGSPNMLDALVDTSAWNSASEGRRIVVPLSFCTGETDQLAVEIDAA